MEEFKGMIMPAVLEDLMQDYEEQLKHGGIIPDIKRKAVADVVHVLKQFGYDAGAEIFERIFQN